MGPAVMSIITAGSCYEPAVMRSPTITAGSSHEPAVMRNITASSCYEPAVMRLYSTKFQPLLPPVLRSTPLQFPSPAGSSAPAGSRSNSHPRRPSCLTPPAAFTLKRDHPAAAAATGAPAVVARARGLVAAPWLPPPSRVGPGPLPRTLPHSSRGGPPGG